ncbi:serine/threonine-protein kinase [Streptomyces sp. NPDC051940]|uniref:serine/threonine-protein kinase n=1 Tax=Streptomyces sp. NPDC051940 TaxID=3155675 RepID=UPI00343CA0D8
MPERVGGYAVEREIGAGGMGTVYLARSRGGRAVAVKVARAELASDAHFRERFRAEVEAARRVGGFHTAPVVDADPDAEAPWLATAYVPGPTLAGLVQTHGPLDEARLRQLGAALAEALQAIHGCGLVHRDLKPGNIIMAADGPRVLDFGIARAMESARLTTTGLAFGTPGFLAPEQALGAAVTGAADVFALGAVLVAAAGGSAFGEGTPMGLMYRSVHEPPDLTAVPEGLRETLTACLAKEPELRPTPGELLDAMAPVGTVAAPPPVPVVPPQPVYGPSTPPAPNPYGQPQPGPYTPTHVPGPYAQPAPGPYTPTHVPGPARDDDISFVAVDSSGGVLVDAGGVTFQSGRSGWAGREGYQFGWDEIGAVQCAPEPGNWLRVTVITRAGAAYHALVHARRGSRLREWLEDLPLVVDCFL